MTVQFQAVMFVAAAPSQGSGAPAKLPKSRQRPSSGARAAHDPALVLGQPLPHMGTCKHYHHSHRCLCSASTTCPYTGPPLHFTLLLLSTQLLFILALAEAFSAMSPQLAHAAL